MKNLILRLSKSDDYTQIYDLNFELIQSSFLTKWIKRYLEAQQRQDSISEPWAFYNCRNQASNVDALLLLNQQIDFCNSLVPDLFKQKLTNIQDRDCLNYLHSVFELNHGKLDAWKSNPLFNAPYGNQLRHSLSQINQLIHKCESLHKKSGPKIRIVWFDLPKTNTFDQDDYKLFTNNLDFGGLYTLYADVGKNLESLTSDNDDHVHDFVPNLHYSADFQVRFYDRDGSSLEQACNQYLNDNWNYFESKGYVKNDPRLTTGCIKLAQLKYHNKTEILQALRDHDNVQSVFVF